MKKFWIIFISICAIPVVLFLLLAAIFTINMWNFRVEDEGDQCQQYLVDELSVHLSAKPKESHYYKFDFRFKVVRFKFVFDDESALNELVEQLGLEYAKPTVTVKEDVTGLEDPGDPDDPDDQVGVESKFKEGNITHSDLHWWLQPDDYLSLCDQFDSGKLLLFFKEKPIDENGKQDHIMLWWFKDTKECFVEKVVG